MFGLRYFSFVTLTSAGYGDIEPGSIPARKFAVAEALVGQISLLVLVSRFVGLNISQAMPPRDDKDRAA